MKSLQNKFDRRSLFCEFFNIAIETENSITQNVSPIANIDECN